MLIRITARFARTKTVFLAKNATILLIQRHGKVTFVGVVMPAADRAEVDGWRDHSLNLLPIFVRKLA